MFYAFLCHLSRLHILAHSHNDSYLLCIRCEQYFLITLRCFCGQRLCIDCTMYTFRMLSISFRANIWMTSRYFDFVLCLNFQLPSSAVAYKIEPTISELTNRIEKNSILQQISTSPSIPANQPNNIHETTSRATI